MERDASLPLHEANPVFGEGSADAKIVFVGEAPGKKEDELQRPFVGRSGQLLTKTLEDFGMKREDVYITNIVKRRPPENRDPLPREIAAYAPYLAEQLKILDPVIIVPLGRFSMNYFLPDAKITASQGTLFKTSEYLVYPVYHPAAALRSTAMLRAFRKSIKDLPKLLREVR